ncbi:hypothetical protein FACS1894201_02360 [Bacteroidia bacterium]|nr:hypothetical protein FACS1894201_02360 [Bacteroidia bacterium]
MLANVEQFSRFELLAHQVVEGFITGLHRSPMHGFSVEFAEHRLYNNGESTRHIDWKLYGKTDKLFVKRYEEETNMRCYIVIDVSNSMAFENKLRFACQAAACLSYLIAKQRDVVGLTVFSDHIEEQTELKSSVAHQKHLFSRLEYYADRKSLPIKETDTDRNAAALLHLIAEQTHKRSMVIIFSDMFDHVKQLDDLFGALQHLRYKQNEVLLFHTMAYNKELAFDYGHYGHRFIDVETGETLKVYPQDVKAQYSDTVQSFIKTLKARSKQYGIQYVDANVDETYSKILHTFLYS